MHSVTLLLLTLATLPGGAGTTLDWERKGHLLILPDVYLNRQGPFRMMIDTGNATSLIRPEAARKLRVAPLYTVELATAARSRKVPAILLDEVRTGSVLEKTVEMLVADGLPPGIDGVLGQTWLIQHDYLLDYRNNRLVLDVAMPVAGVRQRLRLIEGRPAIAAEVDGRVTELVLDSGADQMVLFGSGAATRQVMLFTNGGGMQAGMGSVRLAIPGEKARNADVVRVHGEPAAGLLPTRRYAWVWISNREGLAVLGR